MHDFYRGQGHHHGRTEGWPGAAARPLTIGVGGPVGSGKTALVDRLCKALRETYRLAATQALDALVALDQRLTAFKVPRELRLESRHTGQAFLRAAMALTPPPLVVAFFQQVQQDATPGHHAIAFGLVAQSLGLTEEHTLLAYLYNVNAGLVAAAVRLVPLGQTDGQRLLHNLAPTLLEVVRLYRQLTPEEAWSCTPGLDIRSMQHERLYSRLCRS